MSHSFPRSKNYCKSLAVVDAERTSLNKLKLFCFFLHLQWSKLLSGVSSTLEGCAISVNPDDAVMASCFVRAYVEHFHLKIPASDILFLVIISWLPYDSSFRWLQVPCAAYIQLGVHPGEYCLLLHVCFCVFPMVALSLAACGILANPLIVFVLDFGWHLLQVCRRWETLVARLGKKSSFTGKIKLYWKILLTKTLRLLSLSAILCMN